MRKHLFRWLLLPLFLLAAVVFGADYWVKHSTRQQVYTKLEDIPANKVGLLLGTAKYVSGGRVNLYYQYRIDAALALYKAGKVEFILISGDNSRKEYSEPEDMMADLVAAGVPREKIFLDYAGFRTYDSIVRCREVFGENNVTIISQPFHNERALFIANSKDIAAIAFNAREVSAHYGFKVSVREKFARMKMLADLLFNIDPKFYGPKVVIK